MEKKSKKIYIVLTYTGTFMSKVIKIFTRAKYCHVSISLDEELTQMYSFGRLNAYNPFIGGFVHESLDEGTFKRFYKTETTIYTYAKADKNYTQKGCCTDGEPHERARNGVCAHYDDQG